MNRPTNIILSSIAIILSGLLALMNFSEWYRVKIQKQTAQYPFDSEGPIPYYYKSSELYSTVTLIWGVIFMSLLAFTFWAVNKGQPKLTLISFGFLILFLIGLFFHGKIGVK
jgi:hypothetical protein